MKPETILTAGMAAVRVPVQSIAPTGLQRPLDEAVVDLIARTVEVDGLLYPIIIQKRSFPDAQASYDLVAGGHRLEAHKRLGRKFIHAYVLPTNSETVAYKLKLIENFARSELSPLERADAIFIWTRYRGAQPAHPLRKNRQPHDAGVSRTAKELGISRRTVQRSLKIAKLGFSAKLVARELSLDRNERLLLEVAALPVDDQVDALREFAGHMRADSEEAKQVKVRWGQRLLEVWNRGRPEWRAQALQKLTELEAKNTVALSRQSKGRTSGQTSAASMTAKTR